MAISPPSIVIIGAWNPAIIQPAWLATVIDEVADPSTVPVTVGFQISGGGLTKYKLGNISYVPMADKLNIYIERHDDSLFNEAEAKAIKILRILTHTPVVAFGQNFEFHIDEPDPDSVRVFDLNDDSIPELLSDLNATVQSTSIINSFKLNSCILNMTRKFESGKLLYKFNFHYQVANASEAAERMQNSFKSNSDIVTKMLEKYSIDRLDIVGDTA